MYSKDEIRQARKKVIKKKKFYKHLVSYVTVNLFLFLLNMLTYSGGFWFFFPMMGWGVGLLFHYVDAFGIPGFGMLDKEWENREMDMELRKMKGNGLTGLDERVGEDGLEEDLKLKELQKNYDDSEFV